MNETFGKLAQRRRGADYRADLAEKAPELEREGWKIHTWGPGRTYVYRRDVPDAPTKHYAVAVPAIINALARIRLWHALKALKGRELYCDTDGIIFEGNEVPAGCPISDRLGEWKLEETGEPATIVGQKLYAIAGRVRASGVGRKEQNLSMLTTGKVTVKRMLGIEAGPEKAGTFEERELTLEAVEKEEEEPLGRVLVDSKETSPELVKEALKNT